MLPLAYKTVQCWESYSMLISWEQHMDTTNIDNATHPIQSASPTTIQNTPDIPISQDLTPSSEHKRSSSKLVKRLFSDGWMVALKNILPTYVAIHVACFAITCRHCDDILGG